MRTTRIFLALSLCLLLSAMGYAGDKTSFLKKQFTTRNGYKLNYRILYPLNYDAGKQYPLILFLHGAGERGSDNEAQLLHGGDMFASYENQSKYPAIIIAPQCPADIWWSSYQRPEKEGDKRVYPYSTPVTVRRMRLAASSTVNRTVKPAKPMA